MSVYSSLQRFAARIDAGLDRMDILSSPCPSYTTYTFVTMQRTIPQIIGLALFASSCGAVIVDTPATRLNRLLVGVE